MEKVPATTRRRRQQQRLICTPLIRVNKKGRVVFITLLIQGSISWGGGVVAGVWVAGHAAHVFDQNRRLDLPECEAALVWRNVLPNMVSFSVFSVRCIAWKRRRGFC